MQPGDGVEVAGFHGVIGCVLEADSDGAHEDGQHLSGGSKRDGKGDTGAHFLFAGDNEDGGDDGGQSGHSAGQQAFAHSL